MPAATSLVPLLAGGSLLLLALPLSRSVQIAQDEHLAYVQQRRERKHTILKGVREELESRNDRIQKDRPSTGNGGRSASGTSSGGIGRGGMTGQGVWLDWVDFE